MSATKRCPKCEVTKELDQYHKDKSRKSGRQVRCKNCNKEYDTLHREHKNKYSKLYYHRTKEERRSYRKAYNESHRLEARRYVLTNHIDYCYLIPKYKDIPCLDCGNIFPFVAMDFDHRPDEVKLFKVCSLSKLKATAENISLIEKEIAKCDLICANCHRVRTHHRRSV